MTRHPISLENLIDWLDGRLDPEASQATEAHLSAGCPACQIDLAWLRRMKEIARSDDAVELPSELVARAKAIYRPEALRGSRKIRRAWILQPLQLALALTVLFLLVGSISSAYSPTLFARAGVLSTFSGSVDTKYVGDAEWWSVSQGDRFRDGNRIRTSDGMSVLTLFDGSTVEIEAGAEIALSSLRSSSLGSPYHITVRNGLAQCSIM